MNHYRLTDGPPRRKWRLREIPFGPCGDADETCIYDNGHIDPEEFLRAVREMKGSDIPDEARAALTVADVQHIRFRPMSPTEAKSQGYDFGVMKTKVGGYPVTVVML